MIIVLQKFNVHTATQQYVIDPILNDKEVEKMKPEEVVDLYKLKGARFFNGCVIYVHPQNHGIQPGGNTIHKLYYEMHKRAVASYMECRQDLEQQLISQIAYFEEKVRMSVFSLVSNDFEASRRELYVYTTGNEVVVDSHRRIYSTQHYREEAWRSEREHYEFTNYHDQCRWLLQLVKATTKEQWLVPASDINQYDLRTEPELVVATVTEEAEADAD